MSAVLAPTPWVGGMSDPTETHPSPTSVTCAKFECFCRA